MNAQAYHRRVIEIIAACPLVISLDIAFREIDENECYIKGVLHLTGGHTLHLAEYVVTEPEPPTRLKYRYQLQGADQLRVVRWDNAPHHQDMETFPHHWHDADNMAHPSPAMDLESVLAQALAIVGEKLTTMESST